MLCSSWSWMCPGTPRLFQKFCFDCRSRSEQSYIPFSKFTKCVWAEGIRGRNCGWWVGPEKLQIPRIHWASTSLHFRIQCHTARCVKILSFLFWCFCSCGLAREDVGTGHRQTNYCSRSVGSCLLCSVSRPGRWTSGRPLWPVFWKQRTWDWRMEKWVWGTGERASLLPLWSVP